MSAINIIAISRKTEIRLGLLRRLIKPLFAGGLMGAFAYYIRLFLLCLWVELWQQRLR
jgi:hypothetical protein